MTVLRGEGNNRPETRDAEGSCRNLRRSLRDEKVRRIRQRRVQAGAPEPDKANGFDNALSRSRRPLCFASEAHRRRINPLDWMWSPGLRQTPSRYIGTGQARRIAASAPKATRFPREANRFEAFLTCKHGGRRCIVRRSLYRRFAPWATRFFQHPCRATEQCAEYQRQTNSITHRECSRNDPVLGWFNLVRKVLHQANASRDLLD